LGPLTVLSGRSNEVFARAIAEGLSIDLGLMQVIQFSDGELSVEIAENVRGRDVFLIQSTCEPVNDRLMELLIIVDALRRASAGRITAVMPYFGYARQDRKTKPRVPITAKLVANILTEAGVDRVLTMDLHAGQLMGFFDIPVDNLNAFPVLAPYILRKYGPRNSCVVSPDVGGVERARGFARYLENAPIAVIDKRRTGPNQIAEMHLVGDVRGKFCVIADDMVDTGGTLARAADVLLKEGAVKVVAACVHPVLSGNAIATLSNSSLSEIVVTDSIPSEHKFGDTPEKFTVLSVAPMFADAIRRIHSEDSVSALFS
jgi:ribose-phosphate pyrophosphokinase